MTAVRRYEASMYDSNRWDGFELRPGDIIISTPPKCGTTCGYDGFVWPHDDGASSGST